MIVNKLLEKLFSAPSNISVLRALNERVTGITGRETARLTNLTHRSALKALTILEELGVVSRITGGRDHIFTLNRQKYISKEIIHPIFEAEKNFNTAIRSSLKRQLSRLTESVIVYGSVARKEETISSDYDICIVYTGHLNDIENVVLKLRDRLHDQYSIQLAPIYISRSEFKKRAGKKLPPVKSIVSEGMVLSGKSIHELLQ
jgi:predicted nucleotidyltransferase